MPLPPCDKHKNLQMVAAPLESPANQTLVHVCPVPSCGRCHDDQGYFEVVEGQIVRGKRKPLQADSNARPTRKVKVNVPFWHDQVHDTPAQAKARTK
jgi:hypothetical protein